MSAEATQRPLRRSLFFVPGGEPRKLAKCRDVGADTLLLDLEDSVTLAEKDRAREQVSAFLREGEFGGSEPAVRVNQFGTPYLHRDLESVVAAGARAIMLPKSESRKVLAEVAQHIGRLGVPANAQAGGVRLFALVETAAGVVQAASLPSATPQVEALCFGHADFSRDLGLPEADASKGTVIHARCALVIAARASGVTPVDTVFLDVRDGQGFRRDAELGLELGFEGKLCIHPDQVQIANEVYTPTAAQIRYAQRLLEAHREAESEGRGAFTVDGKMVDAPLIAAQRRVLERARRAGVLSRGGNGDGS